MEGNATKTLRQLQAEEEEEERFQAELKKAVRQSLGKFSVFYSCIHHFTIIL